MSETHVTTEHGTELVAENVDHVEDIEGIEVSLMSTRKLIPDDITTTPPATLKGYMGTGDSHGTWWIELDYPAGVDNTVVRMSGIEDWMGIKMVSKFADNTAEEKGYTIERVPTKAAEVA